MEVSGNILKMRSQLEQPVQYSLPIGDQSVNMNELIGQDIKLSYEGQINCIACGRKTNKSFAQGYCFPCMRSLAECDSCIVKPETCHFDQGTCRDEQWAQDHCMQDHIVYLANSSGIKVGITRQSQVPTRWIDQGASQAFPVMRARNRYMSGLLEMEIKQHVADRTDWRKMLKGEPDAVDLQQLATQILADCAQGIASIREQHGEDALREESDASVVDIQYPVTAYPEKVKSVGFDKMPEISGRLMGIKGQYLILDTGVLNLRKHNGYFIQLTV